MKSYLDPQSPTIEELIGILYFIGSMLITQDMIISMSGTMISFILISFISTKFKSIKKQDEKNKLL